MFRVISLVTPGKRGAYQLQDPWQWSPPSNLLSIFIQAFLVLLFSHWELYEPVFLFLSETNVSRVKIHKLTVEKWKQSADSATGGWKQVAPKTGLHGNRCYGSWEGPVSLFFYGHFHIGIWCCAFASLLEWHGQHKIFQDTGTVTLVESDHLFLCFWICIVWS